MGQMAGAIPAAVSTERRKLGGVGNALCAVYMWVHLHVNW